MASAEAQVVAVNLQAKGEHPNTDKSKIYFTFKKAEYRVYSTKYMGKPLTKRSSTPKRKQVNCDTTR